MRYRRDVVARLVKILGPIVILPGSTPGGGELSILSSNANWVLGLVPNPDKTLPGEVDRCLTGHRGMIHDFTYTRELRYSGPRTAALHETSQSAPSATGGILTFQKIELPTT
ncbi:hypothetical protein F2Q69_00054728 [Brassica cretica]|uniref:Uncharacterized protein n=1 Tax=Brassica cretica TaxID=69181 RepID=A0A8S9N0G9_BRACR|nr:hypothetical protein F2Q69_00054728 [Brassica cretica]